MTLVALLKKLKKIQGTKRGRGRPKKSQKQPSGDVKEMQKRCLDLADQKIALMEQFEHSLDSHLDSLNAQISKMQSSLDTREENSNGLALADIIKLSGSIDKYFTFKIERKEKERPDGRRKKKVRKIDFPVPFTVPSENAGYDNKIYCYCQQRSEGDMIACDNPDCRFKWFHFGCVGITVPPPPHVSWYCDECKAKLKKAKKL